MPRLTFVPRLISMPRLVLLLAVCGGFIATSSATHAQHYYSQQARAAHARYQHYVQYPQQLQMLDNLIRMRKAEIASLELRLKDWESSDRFDTGRALMVTIENTRLVLLQTRMELQQLEQQRFDMVRYRGRYRAW